MQHTNNDIRADLDDVNFMDGMKTLTGLDDDKIEKILDDLDSDSLLALSDAVATKDKNAIDGIMGSFEKKLSSLFGGDNKEEDKKKKPKKPPKDHTFSIGDDVAIKVTDEDTGKDKFITATVFKPNAPGDTLGVKIDGKTKMIKKSNAFVMNEDVMGFVSMPELSRMQQLAGIPVSTEQPKISPEQPMMYDRDEEVVDDDVSRAMEALDTLENVLPNIRFSNVKQIRKRIYDLIVSLNESAPARTKK